MLAEKFLSASNFAEKSLVELGFHRGSKNPLPKTPKTKEFLFDF